MILLDTHSWLWLAQDDPALNKAARQAIQYALLADALFLSPISMWEVALKASRGKLELELPARTWIRRAVNLTGVQLIPISIEVACECAELPPEFYGDPADRLIVATARAENLTVITHDGKLLNLAKKGYFKVIAT